MVETSPSTSRSRPTAGAGLFRGTADYYSRYRPAYPPALFTDLLARAGSGGRLLDLGCGTGEITLPLHTHFAEVHAVDPEPDMIARARAKATTIGADTITWQLAAAEELDPAPVDLITIGSAFHWFDRPLVAARARRWLNPGGHIAICGNTTVWTSTQHWQHRTVEVIDTWLGRPSRPATSTARPETEATRHLGHAEILTDAGFTDVTEHQFPTPTVWTIDELIGYLWSTSIMAPLRADPDTGAEFETELRHQLRPFAPAGRLHETITHYYILTRNPDRMPRQQ